MAQVAISTDFLDALARLPKDKQKKVRAFAEKFLRDPTAASINYEPIHDMADPKVRTVRIDLAYRGIVIHPPQGDVYLMVWVDHHDEAMAWARRKHFEVNPRTGSFQVWEAKSNADVAEPAGEEVRASAPPPPPGLFAARSDDELLVFGLPEPLLPAVRSVRSEAELDGLARYLPQEASDALYLLAAGYTVEAAIEELDRKPSASAEPVDTEDYRAALERPSSQRQFRLVADDRDLSDILAAPLEKWRIFLHPSQRKLVEMHSTGAARVLGGAGTGKTVVALHRARYLAKKPGFLRDGERILLTTFTANLAADLGQALDQLCGAERERIVVKHLHAVAGEILRAEGVKVEAKGENDLGEVWDEALEVDKLDFSLPFYKAEWQHVVQAQDVTDEAAYLRARRVGRGTPISRAQRKQVWAVLSEFRRELDRRRWMDFADLAREARLTLERKVAAPYRAVIADEAQDFRQGDLALLRALAQPSDDALFLVGDAHQRIYGHQASMARAGIVVRGKQARRLRINYRTTQEIRGFAMAVLDDTPVDDLDEGKDDARGERSLRLGKRPSALPCKSADDEARVIIERIRAWLGDGVAPADICVVAREKRTVDTRVCEILARASIPYEVIKKTSESADRTRVRVATMHRVKGLEFRCVLIASAQECKAPQDRTAYADAADAAAREASERHLMYVAATRARDELVVTWFGDAPAVVPRA